MNMITNQLVNRVLFYLNKYKNEEELFKDLAQQMRILTKNEYACGIYKVLNNEDEPVYILEYSDNAKDSQSPLLTWAFSDEIEKLAEYRKKLALQYIEMSNNFEDDFEGLKEGMSDDNEVDDEEDKEKKFDA